MVQNIFVAAGSLIILIVIFYRKVLRCIQYFQKICYGIRQNATVIAFFHPYSNSGGGGERVLWIGIHGLLVSNCLKNTHVVVYTGDVGVTKHVILGNVKNHFGVAFDESQRDRISFVYVRTRPLLEAKWYPVATMLFQCLGSMIVGCDSLMRMLPDVYCDSTGAAFTYPLFKIFAGATVVTYTHYPIISMDMLNKVRERRPAHNNASIVASSVHISSIKVVYYQLFARAYSFVGSFADKVMVNSSWTRGHVSQLWGFPQPAVLSAATVTAENKHADHNTELDDTSIWCDPCNASRKLYLVYPPCNTEHLEALPLARDAHQTERFVISIGQFRPEKDHFLQIRSFKLLLDMKEQYSDVVLVLIGSTRNEGDEKLVEELKALITDLGLPNNSVRFVINQSYDKLSYWMGHALIGIHTMWNEHFGISVVEMMAAGLVVIAHRSGGPLMDIILHDDSRTAGNGNSSHASTGYLCASAAEYAAAMSAALDNYDYSAGAASTTCTTVERRCGRGEKDGTGTVRRSMRDRARDSSRRFSDDSFKRGFLSVFIQACRLK